MMSMNGFTLGFFFPKQDLSPAAKETARPDIKDVQARSIVTSLACDDVADRPAPLSLYAYRFF